MSYADTRAAIGTYLTNNFAGWPIIRENHNYEPAANAVWVRYGLRPNDQRAADIGGNMQRTTGLLWFQIFLPDNTGCLEAQKIGDHLSALFYQKYIVTAGKPTIRCESASLRYVGQDEAGWQQWSVIVPYTVDAEVAL